MRKPKLMLIGNSSDLITLCKLEYVSFLNRSSLNAIGILGPCIEDERKIKIGVGKPRALMMKGAKFDNFTILSL